MVSTRSSFNSPTSSKTPVLVPRIHKTIKPQHADSEHGFVLSNCSASSNVDNSKNVIATSLRSLSNIVSESVKGKCLKRVQLSPAKSSDSSVDDNARESEATAVPTKIIRLVTSNHTCNESLVEDVNSYVSSRSSEVNGSNTNSPECTGNRSSKTSNNGMNSLPSVSIFSSGRSLITKFNEHNKEKRNLSLSQRQQTLSFKSVANNRLSNDTSPNRNPPSETNGSSSRLSAPKHRVPILKKPASVNIETRPVTGSTDNDDERTTYTNNRNPSTLTKRNSIFEDFLDTLENDVSTNPVLAQTFVRNQPSHKKGVKNASNIDHSFNLVLPRPARDRLPCDASTSSLSTFLNWKSTKHKRDPVLKPSLDRESFEHIYAETEIQLAKHDFLTLDSIFTHFSEIEQEKKNKMEQEFKHQKSKAISAEVAKKIIAEKSKSCEVSLYSYMGSYSNQPRDTCLKASPCSANNNTVNQTCSSQSPSFSQSVKTNNLDSYFANAGSLNCQKDEITSSGSTCERTPTRDVIGPNRQLRCPQSAPPHPNLRFSTSCSRSSRSKGESNNEWKNSLFCPMQSKRVKRAIKLIAKDERQQILDFGQRDIGPRCCPACGFIFIPSNPTDTELHEKFHNNKFRLIKYCITDNDTVLAVFSNGCIVTSSNSSSLLNKKIDELKKRVDGELGFVDELPTDQTDDNTNGTLSESSPNELQKLSQVLVFISKDNQMVGYLLAQKIDLGYRVISEESKSSAKDNDNEPQVEDRSKVMSAPDEGIDCGSVVEKNNLIGPSWSCSLVGEPASCGISRIWVAPQYQRQNIATYLVDTIRSHFIHKTKTAVPKDLVAFSDPTNAGRCFAISYTGRKDFLVFKCFQSTQPVRDFLKEQEERDKLLL